MPRPRVAAGGVMHETHTFMRGLTTLADFANGSFHRGQGMLSAMAGTRSGIGGMIDSARTFGWDILPTLYAAAMPAGTVSGSAYQALLTELLERVRGLRPLDGLLLALHGAMAAESERDVEADILRKLREIVGDAIPIVVLLDMHGNIGRPLVALADVLLAYSTNPHIDVYDRGVEAAAIMNRLLQREIRPAAAIVQPGLLLPPQSTDTADPPLAAVHARATAMQAEPAVIAIAIMAGFAYADTPDTGASVVVTTDGQPDLAQRYARELADMLYGLRHEARPRGLSPAEAVKMAAAHPKGPVILVDSADNIGGGTPGDGTDALAAMLDFGAREGTIVLADSEAVALCWQAGQGARLTVDVGGKVDDWHGAPLRVIGEVRALSDGRFRFELPDNHFASFYGEEATMGRCAWLRVAGVNILLSERRTPPMDLGQLRHIGIIPEAQSMIVVKSAVAYRAAYLPIAAAVIEMDCAGLCSADLSRFSYRHLRRPIFPLD